MMIGGVSVFLRNSFSPTSFSPVSFNGAMEQQSGRSGYWRLFFTQLQEEADKSSEKLGVPEADQPNKGKVAQPLTLKKNKEKKRKVRLKEEPSPFRPLPAFTPVPIGPNYLADMWIITSDLRNMVASLQQSTVKFNQQLDARNDEDDIELLLLVM